MTKSQITAILATIATVISAVCAAVLPQIQTLPERYRFYGSIVSIIGAAAGSVVIALNQSLSPSHRSIPEKKAKKVIKDHPKVAKELGLEEKLPPLDAAKNMKGEK